MLAFYVHAQKHIKRSLFQMVMFHIFARTLKGKGQLIQELIACTFTFHKVRLVFS
jgi:hypothetical protein